MIFSFASLIEKNPARSISGKSWKWPERGGHSRRKVLLRILVGSRLPSNAQARTTFPPLSFTSPTAETDLAAEIRFLPQTRAEPSPARFPHDSLPLWGYSRRRDPFWPRTVHRGVRAAPPPGLVVFGT